MKSTATSAFAFLIFALFIFFPFSAFTSNTKPPNKRGISISSLTSKEKIYIHSDKTIYTSGENIWYKVYLVDATNNISETLSKVVYVDLIDSNNTIIESKTIKINYGTGKGDFKLPSNSSSGNYTIRAYTNFMRNFDATCFFTKTIIINPENNQHINNTDVAPNDRLGVNFFPEGGNIVSGFVNSVGFKAVNKNGKGVSVSGTIINKTGETVRRFRTSKLGQGVFQFIPAKGENYKATVFYNGKNYTYDFPPVKDQGVLMRVNESYEFFRINIYSSLFNSMGNLKLVGLQKGDIVCETEINGSEPEIAINISKTGLNSGLIEFNLLDKNGTVLSKALAFSDSNNFNQNATIKTSKTIYDKNELVQVDIDLNEILQKNTIANASVSVTEVSDVTKTSYDSDIKSHLFLTSELSNDIEQPSYYIHSNDSQRKDNLNLLLRSQKINQNLFKKDSMKNSLNFSLESGFNFKGIVKEIRKGKPVKAHVTVTYKNSNDLGYDKTVTDSLGRFNFDGLNFNERTFVSIKAERIKARDYHGDFIIILDTVAPPLVSTKRISNKNFKKGTLVSQPKTTQNRNTEFAPRKGEIKLGQVNLVAEKKRLDRYAEKRKFALYKDPGYTLDIKNSPILYPNLAYAFQGKIPGFQAVGRKLIIRGQVIDMGDDSDPFKIGTQEEENRLLNTQNKPKPLFLIDGFPTDYDLFISMPIHDIDFIDVIVGPRTAIYGLRGGGIVIALYTLDGSEVNEELSNRKVSTNFYHPGYYQARKFYRNKDNSSTLYWNPDLKLEQSSNSKIVFNTANKSATYKVLLEGITSDGIPFKAENYFDVN